MNYYCKIFNPGHDHRIRTSKNPDEVLIGIVVAVGIMYSPCVAKVNLCKLIFAKDTAFPHVPGLSNSEQVHLDRLLNDTMGNVATAGTREPKEEQETAETSSGVFLSEELHSEYAPRKAF